MICNSDQGRHFTSPPYTPSLRDAGGQIRMAGTGCAIDNIFTAQLWRRVKYEDVYLKEYADPKAARRSLTTDFDRYNHRRWHQTLA